MKKTLLLLMVSVALFGCQKENSPALPNDKAENNVAIDTNALMTGTWVLTADTLTSYENGNPTTSFNNTLTKTGQGNLLFNLNGTYSVINDQYDSSASTWAVSKGQLTLNLSYKDGPKSTTVSKITKLTATNLSILTENANANVSSKMAMYYTKKQ